MEEIRNELEEIRKFASDVSKASIDGEALEGEEEEQEAVEEAEEEASPGRAEGEGHGNGDGEGDAFLEQLALPRERSALPDEQSALPSLPPIPASSVERFEDLWRATLRASTV